MWCPMGTVLGRGLRLVPCKHIRDSMKEKDPFVLGRHSFNRKRDTVQAASFCVRGDLDTRCQGYSSFLVIKSL